MPFEVKRTGAVEYGVYMKVLMCSGSGVGKTPWAATAPNPLFLVLDNGMMSIADRNLPYIEVTHTDQLKEIGKALSQSPDMREARFGAPVDTVVVETIDWVQRYFKNEYMLSHNLDAMDQRGWGWLADRMQDFALKYLNLPLNVVFNCHLTDVKDEQAGDIFVTPSLQGAFGKQAPELLDLALLMKSQTRTKVGADGKSTEFETRRWIQTYQDARHGWIKDRSNKLPNEFEVNFVDDWQRMQDLIYGDIEKRQAEFKAALEARNPVPEPPASEVEPADEPPALEVGSEVPVEVQTPSEGSEVEATVEALAEFAVGGANNPADPEDIARLTKLMDDIEDQTWRTTVKKGFFTQFGKPDELKAGQVAEAEALIREMLE